VIITLERRGGFAGVRRTVRLDSSSLPAGGEGKLRGAVEAAGFFTLAPAPSATRSAPDRFRYRLAIEDGARRHAVVVDEEAAGAALRALVSLVEELAENGDRGHLG
jgi:hypothetical protein